MRLIRRTLIPACSEHRLYSTGIPNTTTSDLDDSQVLLLMDVSYNSLAKATTCSIIYFLATCVISYAILTRRSPSCSECLLRTNLVHRFQHSIITLARSSHSLSQVTFRGVTISTRERSVCTGRCPPPHRTPVLQTFSRSSPVPKLPSTSTSSRQRRRPCGRRAIV